MPTPHARHGSHQARPPKSVLEPPEWSRHDPTCEKREEGEHQSSEAIGGRTSTSAAAPEVSAAAIPVEEGEGGTPLDDAPLGREGATLN